MRRLLVVVPARNEETLVGRCVDAVGVAVAAALRYRPDLAVAVVVVADTCTDRTAEVARAHGARVVEATLGCVGAARRTGVDAGTALLPPAPAELTWVAGTDADSVVPADWLVRQLELAARGVGLVTGRAEPDRADLDPTTWRAWQRRHPATAAAAHVHGANLGLRLDHYLAVGGWPALAEHEDRRLVEALLAAGVPAGQGTAVITSGRLHGRAPGGFSGYLRALADRHPDAAL